MGLLDSLFDSSTYGGNGGLLARLQPSLADIPQSPGFQGQAPNLNPIAVGGYQMPRIGDAAQYQTDPAALPPNAQPTQGQIPAATPQPQQLPPALGGNQFGGNIGAGLQNFVNSPGGLLGKTLGGITGALTGQRTDPIGVQQQNLRAQFDATRQALIANGVPEQQANSTAMLSVLNPEAAKTVLPELLTNKEKYQVISEDPLEGKKYGFVNEREQTVNGKPLGQGGITQSGGMGALTQAQNAGVTGEALYNYVPPAMRGTIKAMIEGRQPLPSTTAMRSPATLALIDAAHAIDPTFDATTWKARNEAGPDWTKGKSSEMVRAANQTLHHLDSLMTAMDDLKNGRNPTWNALGNSINENVWGTGQQGAFRTNAHAVAEEMSKVFKGANLSDSEIRHWEQNLSENMSPEQQRAQIAKLAELLHGSLDALEEKRISAMGPAQAAKMGPIIKPEGQAVLEKLDAWVKQNPAKADSASANTTKSGVKWSVVK